MPLAVAKLTVAGPAMAPDLVMVNASILLRAGVPVKVVSERLGHANIAITMDTYSHVLPGMDERGASVVARLILDDEPPGEAAR